MLSDGTTNFLCIAMPLAGLIFAVYNRYVVGHVQIMTKGEYAASSRASISSTFTAEHMGEIHTVASRITEGARSFLISEYKVIFIFVIMTAFLIYFLIGSAGGTDSWNNAFFSAVAFIVGAVTSCVSGGIGMLIAVYSNSRTAHEAAVAVGHEKYSRAFNVAFRGGIVMGFALTSVGMLSLFLTLHVFRAFLGDQDQIRLYECIAAFGLGGSTIACFGRVGGGIFTKAADVGADLCGKVVKGLPEDDRRNPGVIADCIGDNVGDIAGMGSDLFGSFGEATCAALVVSAYAGPELTSSWSAMMYPLLITGTGIIVCMITSVAATSGWPVAVHSSDSIEPALKWQLGLSTMLATVALYFITILALPDTFSVAKLIKDASGSYVLVSVHAWEAALCVIMGLWAGLLIGLVTEYYTSNRNPPVQSMAHACAQGGAATNVISGLAVGYLSTIVPCFAMAGTMYISFNLCLMYGIALAALGILSTMSIGLTIDAYGPIADNAGGIVEMCMEDQKHIREVTDSLDAAGNTTAAIGKGFAISSAAFVALALYGAFITHAEIPVVNIVDSRVFPGLLVGAMLPYWFSGWTMMSVNKAAMEMVREIKRQFTDDSLPDQSSLPASQRGKATKDLIMSGEIDPDYNRCVAVATNASLVEMIHSGGLVMLTPIVTGILFGKEALSGLLPGALVSGVQMAISMSNTGGAWDNAKKLIEAGRMEVDAQGLLRHDKDVCQKTLHYVRKRWHHHDHGYSEQIAKVDKDIHDASVIGDTVGDPMKDTSGPALNILVKLMAIISVVFVPVVNSPTFGGIIFDQWLSGFTLCASVPGNECA